MGFNPKQNHIKQLTTITQGLNTVFETAQHKAQLKALVETP
jgi:hypothetical protein